MTVLNYLRQELNFELREWKDLPQADKDTLKVWAEQEMRVRGIEVK